jgi:hypothetical protein
MQQISIVVIPFPFDKGLGGAGVWRWATRRNREPFAIQQILFVAHDGCEMNVSTDDQSMEDP